MPSGQFSLLTGLFFICSVAGADESFRSLGEKIESTLGNDDGSLHLEIEQVPLGQIFKIIEAQTGVRLHASLISSKLVTATCAGTTLGVLKCLLGREVNLIYRYSGKSSAGYSMPLLTDVWVLNSNPGERRLASDTRICSTTENLNKTIQDGRQASPEEQIAALRLEQDETEKLIELAQSANPMRRQEALSRLVFADQTYDYKVSEILKDALQDQNAGVRAQAVSVLARRNSPETDSALTEALHDSDVGVRLMVVSNAGKNIYLLESALSDPNRLVRNLARMKLNKISETNSEQ